MCLKEVNSRTQKEGVKLAINYAQIFRTAAADDASENECARGVANILESLGVPHTRGHAYQWNDTLARNGWKQIQVDPANAPPGALLVYDRTTSNENAPPGQRFGHVELVSLDAQGNRKYVSDKARTNFGGSDRNRPLTVWVHDSLQDDNPAAWPTTTAAGRRAVARMNGQDEDLTGTFAQNANPGANINPLLVLTAFVALLAGEDPAAMQNLVNEARTGQQAGMSGVGGAN